MNIYKIIEITTPTCSVCKMIKPMLAKAMESFHDVEMVVVDHQDDIAVKLAEKYSIRTVPAFFFMKNDEVIDTHYGAIAMTNFKNKVNTLKSHGC